MTDDKAREGIPGDGNLTGRLSTNAHKQPTNCFSATLQNGDFVQALHTQRWLLVQCTFCNSRPKLWCEHGPQICNYFEVHADTIFFDKPSRDPGCTHDVFAQLWSDQSLHVSGNNVAQKAALSLSDKHQTVWGREEVQSIFYVENWKAFIKWL